MNTPLSLLLVYNMFDNFAMCFFQGGVAPSHPPNMPVTSGGSVVMPGSYPGGVNRGQQQAHPNGASHHQPQSNAGRQTVLST